MGNELTKAIKSVNDRIERVKNEICEHVNGLLSVNKTELVEALADVYLAIFEYGIKDLDDSVLELLSTNGGNENE